MTYKDELAKYRRILDNLDNYTISPVGSAQSAGSLRNLLSAVWEQGFDMSEEDAIDFVNKLEDHVCVSNPYKES